MRLKERGLMHCLYRFVVSPSWCNIHGEGCNIHGSLEVNKVAGNFHFAPGKGFHQQNVHLFDLLALQAESYNLGQRIWGIIQKKIFKAKDYPMLMHVTTSIVARIVGYIASSITI